MKTALRRVLCFAAILAVILSYRVVFAESFTCPTSEAAPGASGGNAEPLVVPSLQSWVGGSGMLLLAKNPRIVVEKQNASALLPVAHELANDLHGLTGRVVSVKVADKVGNGDIGLSLRPCGSVTKTKIGDEGYSLDAARPFSSGRTRSTERSTAHGRCSKC